MLASILLVKRCLNNNDTLVCGEVQDESSSEDELLILKKPEKHLKIANYISKVVLRYSDTDFRAHFRLSKSSIEVGI